MAPAFSELLNHERHGLAASLETNAAATQLLTTQIAQWLKANPGVALSSGSLQAFLQAARTETIPSLEEMQDAGWPALTMAEYDRPSGPGSEGGFDGSAIPRLWS